MIIDKDNIKVLLILLIVGLGIGYAYINSDLNINGTAQVNSANWDVHWANIQVKSGSVIGDNVVTAPTISNSTTVNFSVVLPTPGDYYEFTVDAVNAGVIDAMIDTIDSKLNGATITTLPDYLSYEVTYSDGVELEPNHQLLHNTTETYKVKVKYRDDIELSQIPASDQTLSLSFTITYRQATDDASEVKRLYNVLKKAANEGTYAKEYTGEHHDSFTETPSKKIYHWYGSDDTNGTAILDMNNVIFANFCWQMIRTTDTGGVKMVYNGVPSDGVCNNSETNQQIGTAKFNSNNTSLADAGYMYNTRYGYLARTNSNLVNAYVYGNSVTYANGTYTLINNITSTGTWGTDYTTLNSNHYTCFSEENTCESVYYVFRTNASNAWYITLTNGQTVEDALKDMLSADNVNQTNSTIKTAIDNWYASNMTSYTSKLEDTIFCNDRSISDLGGWEPDGGSVTTSLVFKNYSSNGDLNCTNTTDKFSVSNAKAKLTYPVGLLTSPEIYLLNNENLIKTGNNYWTISASYLFNNYINGGFHNCYVKSSGSLDKSRVTSSFGLRPAISLKPGTVYTSGDGSKNNPYIVE